MADELKELLHEPKPDHVVRPVPDPKGNPTLSGDLANADCPEERQYPPIAPERTRYIYDADDVLPDEADYAWFGGSLLRCSRTNHSTLAEAQLFFAVKRANLRWSHEAPIYRTGRFWCKRVWGITT